MTRGRPCVTCKNVWTLNPAAGPDTAAELDDDVVEEGAGAGASLADCDGNFKPPLVSGADGDRGGRQNPSGD